MPRALCAVFPFVCEFSYNSLINNLRVGGRVTGAVASVLSLYMRSHRFSFYFIFLLWI